jgi:hypothetical protein
MFILFPFSSFLVWGDIKYPVLNLASSDSNPLITSPSILNLFNDFVISTNSFYEFNIPNDNVK